MQRRRAHTATTNRSIPADMGTNLQPRFRDPWYVLRKREPDQLLTEHYDFKLNRAGPIAVFGVRLRVGGPGFNLISYSLRVSLHPSRCGDLRVKPANLLISWCSDQPQAASESVSTNSTSSGKTRTSAACYPTRSRRTIKTPYRGTRRHWNR